MGDATNRVALSAMISDELREIKAAEKTIFSKGLGTTSSSGCLTLWFEVYPDLAPFAALASEPKDHCHFVAKLLN